MAMTADGKIATANRAVTSFGSKRDLDHLYELRATADAVMCGARTVEQSNSVLSPGAAKFRRLRKKNGLAEYNLRVIVSGSGSINTDANIFKKYFSPVIVLTTARISGKDFEKLKSAAAEVRIFGENEINFRAAFQWLREKWNVKRLLCEGGGELNAAVFRAGLVDELHLTICPKIFGGRRAPTIADGYGFEQLARAAKLELTSMRRKKRELFTVFSCRNNSRF